MAAFFLLIDSAFFVANLTKIAEGGYVPLILAVCVYAVMWIWHRGWAAVIARMHETLIPVEQFMQIIEAKKIPRVPGTAVFLTRAERDTPPVMQWHVRHNRALHTFERFCLCCAGRHRLPVPWLTSGERITIEQIVPNFWRAEARFRLHGTPVHIPDLLTAGKIKRWDAPSISTKRHLLCRP